ncbi:Long-chain-fatty-acid--CoA ligase 5 isoform X2 [Oopsacas minuta]|uniref:Long-chain-fatty-acid--CoA ligase n=1 Tax=Oopsacas minuta TaxID=111878 RepID=A0AAV7JTQ2_9METZ|nr:Long-chain-fatty-acid--CoA ligase 5 isoform X2 [Oopsacas minuta]
MSSVRIQFPRANDVQSRPLKDDPCVRVSAFLPENGDLMETTYNDVKTLYNGFQRGLKLAKDLACLGTRQFNRLYKYETYSQIQERIDNFGSGLINRGHLAGQRTFIGIASKNCPEWVIVEQACNAYSQVLVPLYDTLGPEAIEHIITQANTEVVVLSADRFADRLKSVSHTKKPKLIVKIGKVSVVDKKLAAEYKVDIVSMGVLEEEGKKCFVQHVPPKPDDLATVCYTSGTTGKPKGAMLTHRNIIADCAAATSIMEGQSMITTEDYHLSYLPMAHMYERIIQVAMFMNGGKICFFQGDIKLLTDDILACRPTIFISVPRLLNRLYDKTMSLVNSNHIKKLLFNFALKRKKIALDNGIISRNTIWDSLLFKRFQDALGGRVRIAITGAAPLSPDVLTFLRCALGCIVLEGYGQTECTAGATMTLPGESQSGHVGPPLPCNIVKVVDVPDMEYYAKNGEGEVCFKGPNVFKGYLHDEFKTKEAIDSDGWLHSGDIGKWLDNGCLKIIDRKKHIVKLSNGEYIAPEKIENCYARHPAIMQAFVHANSLYPFPVAILVADPDTFEGWAGKKGIKGSIEESSKNKSLINTIVKELDSDAKLYGLNSFERIKYIYITTDVFTVENELLTPTFKLRRIQVTKKYKHEIDELLATQRSSAASK